MTNIFKSAALLLFTLSIALLISVTFWPRIDLIVSGQFYTPGRGFFLADYSPFVFLHWLAYDGARVLGVFLALMIVIAAVRRKPCFGIDKKAWLFLFLGLLIAPGLIGNVLLKDHWGRARPREVTEFGGGATFSPALIPQNVSRTNGSFVSGDAAFGFFLPSFGYAVPRRRSRRFFWGGMFAAGLFSIARLAMGAHFLSDTLFAALFMLGSVAVLHAAMYHRPTTRSFWREWLFLDKE